ncbi:MAG: sensor domain-containing diguanylate cyclase [Candidatus Omnitrophica bacterium]|nr:sensor domain-containing diguanylate cyclase [Candidatus Omnitrophota bacterium]
MVIALAHGNAGRKHRLEIESQGFQERLNILSDANLKGIKTKAALQEKIRRYHSLKEIIENLNRALNTDTVGTSLITIAFSLIANHKGACILYLVDQQNHHLSAFKTKKDDKRLIIKEKEGDIFDFWILRHAAPLLIEDARKDFRFDLERLSLQETRSVSSLIGAPLLSEHNFLGILRMDNPVPGFYTQDDLRLLVTICDIGAVALENSELYRKTQDLAIHDGLTSLYTKGYFLERIREEARRSIRQKAVFCLFMLDIDHFKNINDSLGHTAGDLVLKEISLLLTVFLKSYGAIISRFGGEEFCVILPHVEKKKAHEAAEDLRLKISEKKINIRGQDTRVTVSIGVTAFPDDTTEENDLILKADMAMYEAKQKGRNRVVCVR